MLFSNINVQRRRSNTPLHRDNHGYACKKLNKKFEDFERVLVFLTDWEVGQVFGCEKECITDWKEGDCYTFDQDQHFSNTGMETKYSIVISVLKEYIK